MTVSITRFVPVVCWRGEISSPIPNYHRLRAPSNTSPHLREICNSLIVQTGRRDLTLTVAKAAQVSPRRASVIVFPEAALNPSLVANPCGPSSALLAFEYEDVRRCVARGVCGDRQGLEIGGKFVPYGLYDLVLVHLNPFQGARVDPSR